MNKPKQPTTSLIPVERIERVILLIRGEKVMLDADLAAFTIVTPSKGFAVPASTTIPVNSWAKLLCANSKQPRKRK